VPSLGVIIVNNWLCLSVRVSVCHAPSNCFFFVCRWNRAIFWPSVLHVALYKRCPSIFDLGHLTPKIYSPKLRHKITYKSACMADRPEMFGPTRGFSGMANSMEPCKMLWADPCCHGNEISARRGDPVAYWLVCMLACLCLCVCMRVSICVCLSVCLVVSEV